jgi:hypothetical protein
LSPNPDVFASESERRLGLLEAQRRLVLLEAQRRLLAFGACALFSFGDSVISFTGT